MVAASVKKKIVISWSTGKDSAWALHRLQQDPTYEIVGLVTAVVPKWGRVSMHGVRESLALAQAKAAGLLWYNVYLDWPCTNAQYETNMRDALHWLRRERQVDVMAFGDLYLADVRAYRERLLQETGIEPLFPLWGLDTRALAGQMIDAGLRARIVCLDPHRVPRALAGAEFDRAFLEALPAGTDPCAESGEFHTFCYSGPMFREPIPIQTGNTVEREGFVYTDLTLTIGQSNVPITSPCVNVCRMHETTGFCVGCGRALTEIAAWSTMTEAERQRVLAALPDRNWKPPLCQSLPTKN